MTTRKVVNLSIVAFILIVQGCQFIEINIVQRAIMEEGEGLSSTSVDRNLKEESNEMELIVPLK